MMLRDFYKKKNFILIFSLLLVVAFLSAATYAYIIFSINVTNASYNSMTACFDVDYDITNDDGTLPITGTLFHSATPKGGLSGKVSVGIKSTCEAAGIGTINLNVKSGGSVLFQTVGGHCENIKTLQTLTDYKTQTACESVEGTQWVTTGTALKYAIYEDLKSEPVSVGYVTGTGIISVYDNIVLSHTMKPMYIYVWLDGELTDNSYADIAFNSSVEAAVKYIKLRENIFIIDAVCKSNNCENNNVNYRQTLLDSSISLGTNADSKVTYQITLFNNTDVEYVYKETVADENFYDNNNIIFNDTLNEGDSIAGNGGSLTFDITFSYEDGTNINNSTLNSYINFIFVPRTEVSLVSLAFNNTIINKTLDKETTSIEFVDQSIQSGVVIGCNHNATPNYVNNVLSITNISDNTVCTVSNSLKDGIEKVDNTKNNLLMINNDNTTSQISITADQKINLNINGKSIVSTLSSNSSSLVNNGYFEIYDDTNNGTIQTNKILFENKGELIIHSGNFVRKNSSSQTEGKVILNNGGTLTIDGGVFDSDGDNTILAVGNSISNIKNAEIQVTGSLSNAVTNASNNGILSIQNSSVTSTSGGVTSMNNPLGTYISKSTIIAPNGDLATSGGSIHYTADVIFSNKTNVPNVFNQTNSGYLYVKNFIINASDDWYYVKDINGNKVKTTSGEAVLVGNALEVKHYSGFVLDIYGGNIVSGETVQIYTSNSTDAQKFVFLASNDSNYYNIAPYLGPTLFFNMAFASSVETAETYIGLYTGNDRLNERYKFDIANNSDYYELKSYYGTNIDLDGSAANFTTIRSYRDNSSTSQYWQFARK